MAWEPDYVTTAEQAAYMRIGGAYDDDELALIVTAASRAVDGTCNRQFGKSTGAETRRYPARFDHGRCLWVVDTDDFMSTTGFLVEVGGVEVTDCHEAPDNADLLGVPWTRIEFGRYSSVIPTIDSEFRVDVTLNEWGWSQVPAAVIGAAKLQGSRFHSRRDAPFGVAGSPDQGSEMRLLARLDPDVAVMLGPRYRRARRPR